MNIALALIAAFVTVTNGFNDPTPRGKIVAVEAITVAPNQTVTLASVNSVTEQTNLTQQVIKDRVRFDMVLTNWNGQVTIFTNEFDRFTYEKWADTNGVSHIIAGPTQVWFKVTNDVVVGKLPGATYWVTNQFFSTAASGHVMTNYPNAWYLGGRLLLNAGADDNVKLIIEE